MPISDPAKRKEYQARYHKKWYSDPENAKKHKENARANNRLIRDRNNKFLSDYKASKGCEWCRERHPEYIERHPAALQFHHSDANKEGNLSDLANRMYGLKRIIQEIEKCVVVCGNCHSVHHSEVRQSQARNSVARVPA